MVAFKPATCAHDAFGNCFDRLAWVENVEHVVFGLGRIDLPVHAPGSGTSTIFLSPVSIWLSSGMSALPSRLSR